MHTGIKQIYWYCSCLSSHQSLGKASRNSWGRAALQADHKHQEQGCWHWHAKSEKWFPNPPPPSLCVPAEPAVSFQVKEAFCCNREGCTGSEELLEEGGSGMQCICSRSTQPCEHEKDLFPEETTCACLADTKAPLSSEMPIELTIQRVYVHGSNKIISSLGSPTELLAAASTGFFPVFPLITTTGPGGQHDGKTHRSHVLGKIEHALSSTINWLKWTHMFCSKSVYTWHQETAMKKTNPIQKVTSFHLCQYFNNKNNVIYMCVCLCVCEQQLKSLLMLSDKGSCQPTWLQMSNSTSIVVRSHMLTSNSKFPTLKIRRWWNPNSRQSGDVCRKAMAYKTWPGSRKLLLNNLPLETFFPSSKAFRKSTEPGPFLSNAHTESKKISTPAVLACSQHLHTLKPS